MSSITSCPSPNQRLQLELFRPPVVQLDQYRPPLSLFHAYHLEVLQVSHQTSQLLYTFAPVLEMGISRFLLLPILFLFSSCVKFKRSGKVRTQDCTSDEAYYVNKSTLDQRQLSL